MENAKILKSGLKDTNCLQNPLSLDIQIKLVICRDYPSVHRANANGIKSLK